MINEMYLVYVQVTGAEEVDRILDTARELGVAPYREETRGSDYLGAFFRMTDWDRVKSALRPPVAEDEPATYAEWLALITNDDVAVRKRFYDAWKQRGASFSEALVLTPEQRAQFMVDGLAWWRKR